MDIGIINAAGNTIPNPLPISWLGRADAPSSAPAWATAGPFTSKQINCLQAQIGYDKSQWDYGKIGERHQLGMYQFTAGFLESYGLLAQGSTLAYGLDAVNYKQCWRSVLLTNRLNSFQNYLYNATSQYGFLSNKIMQDHLAYQAIVDLYVAMLQVEAVTSEDSPDTLAGMIYVAWQLGPGGPPDALNQFGSGAWSWRYYNQGNAADYFNSGRYAIQALTV